MNITLLQLFKMRQTQFIMPLFTPDIMEYIAGREVVCQLILEECKLKSTLAAGTISAKSRLFTELHFSNGAIIEILLATASQLQIKISYRILLWIDNYSTVEDLATQLW